MDQPTASIKQILGDLTLGQLWAVILVVSSIVSGAFGLGVKFGPILVSANSQKAVASEAIENDSNAPSVVAFLKSQPGLSYQWGGYSADLTQLNYLVQQFLTNVKKTHTTYPAAQSFYRDMDLATGMVIRRAKDSFASPGEVATAKADYNWDVYCIPSLFRIHLADLKEAHAAGLSGEQIARFQQVFEEWRNNAPK
jgi:hypothetical protein